MSVLEFITSKLFIVLYYLNYLIRTSFLLHSQFEYK